jgi:hypothetical protein
MDGVIVTNTMTVKKKKNTLIIEVSERGSQVGE